MSENTKEKIKELSKTMTNIQIARLLGFERRTIARILKPDRLKKQEKKYSGRLIRMDIKELPEGNFNVYEKWNWLVG